MNTINKNRFRNFCIGLSLSCCFVLWAFNLESVPKVHVFDIIYDPGGVYVQIQSHFIPEEIEVEKEKVQPKAKATPYNPSFDLQIVDDLKKLTTITKTQIFEINLNTARVMPQPVVPMPITVHPDVLPQYPGGRDALLDFLQDNVKYPESCVIGDLSGRVVVRFVVDEEGKISSPEVIKDELGCRAAEEALRVMKNMPRWKPGLKDGIPVKAYFIQVFSFRMR